LQSIIPDLATSLLWNEDGTQLTFRLREGVKWHDGKPFTARDVQCTWDLIAGRTAEKLRINPRKSWYRNLDEVTTNSDFEVTFHLKRPQPSFIRLLASGWSPVYPCHVSPRDMRTHPIGTGPFKFVEFKPNESIKVARNVAETVPTAAYVSARCSHGSRSSGNMCLVGRNNSASSNAPTWKSVSVGRPTVSQVSVDPHRAQKPRSVFPGVDSNLAISPLVTVYAVRS